MVRKKHIPVTIAIILGLSIVYLPGLTKLHELNDRKEAIENRIRELEAQNRAFELEIKRMKEDPVYLEKVAREKFRAVREGEIIYKIEKE